MNVTSSDIINIEKDLYLKYPEKNQEIYDALNKCTFGEWKIENEE